MYYRLLQLIVQIIGILICNSFVMMAVNLALILKWKWCVIVKKCDNEDNGNYANGCNKHKNDGKNSKNKIITIMTKGKIMLLGRIY